MIAATETKHEDVIALSADLFAAIEKRMPQGEVCSATTTTAIALVVCELAGQNPSLFERSRMVESLFSRIQSMMAVVNNSELHASEIAS